MEHLSTVIGIFVSAIALKAILVGSYFSFYDWFKYGKEYIDWYANRETWEDRKPKNFIN